MAKLTDTDFVMVRGDTLAFGVEIEGLGQDLDTCYFSCKTDPSDTSYVFQKSLDDGITVVEQGKYRVRVAPDDTENLNTGKYFYDLEIGINGDIYTVLRGKLEIVYDITREE